MHVDTQISRGMEKLLARGAGAYLEGMFGLAGLGSCESFRELETHAIDAGVPNMPRNMRTLRAKHRCLCDNIRAALPVAVNVKNMLDQVAPFPATVSQQLGALGSAKAAAKAQKAAAKAQKKIAKIQAKEAKQEAKVTKKVAKLQAAGKTAKAAKVIAKDAKQDAKVAAKLVKLENKLTAAQQAVATATQVTPAATPAAAPTITPATVSTPTETAAAVLAQQAQVPVATPQAQQLMQEVVANAAQPGSAVPAQSLSTPASEVPQINFQMPVPQGGGSQAQPVEYAASEPVAEGGMFGNVNPWILAGGGVAVLLVLTKVMGKR